jgi:hypothetical protein
VRRSRHQDAQLCRVVAFLNPQASGACTYGGDQSCSEENRYPAWGAGLQYILKPIQGIVANLEYAQGKDGNYGVYLKMGYAY